MRTFAGAAEVPVSRRAQTQFANRHIHFVGIGGSGMRNLARLLVRHGAVVSGSDLSAGPATEELVSTGVRIAIGHDPAHVGAATEMVVVSAAVPEDNPEVVEARRRDLPVLRYAELLGILMQDTTGVAVAGTHGKSTTASLTAYALRRAGLSPSFIIGAEVPQLGGGSGVGAGPFLVAEACEYQRSFLHLRPRLATVLNIDEDHLDYYQGLDDIISAFGAFAAAVRPEGVVLVNADDGVAGRQRWETPALVETFGTAEGATWRASAVEAAQGCYAFDVYHAGRRLVRVRLGIAGRHNVSNALAAFALAWHCGADVASIAAALEQFRGVDRRLSRRGCFSGVVVLDDYAHHPAEIRATLYAARERYSPRRLIVVFQPHQHSRTRFLLEAFAESLAQADLVLVPDIYFVRDSEADRTAVGAPDLVARLRARGCRAQYCPHLELIADRLADVVTEGDVVLTMGAGDVWKVADELVARLPCRG